MIACSRGGNEDYIDGIIVFDNAKDYPELDLKLSDVADVTYIPLKGLDEGFLIENRHNKGSDVFIGENEIYLYQQQSGMLVFDMSGNPLRRLDRSGRGPEEWGSYALDGWVEPESNSVYVRGMEGIYEYDATTFKFRRSGWPKFTFSLPHSFAPLNRDYVIVQNKYQYGSEGNNGSHDTFFLASKSDWTLTPLPITLERPYVHDLDGWMEHSAMIPGRGGLFLCNMRCDTIAWIDRSTMKVTPRMVDKTNYPERDQSGHDIMAVPSFETDRYLFFSILFQPLVREDQEMRAFVFDKHREKIFRLPQPTEEQTATRWSELQFNMQLPLARNECFLTTWSTTLNEEYGAELFQAMNLVDNIDRLPPELKTIAATLKEDDNPVLMLIKLIQNQ